MKKKVFFLLIFFFFKGVISFAQIQKITATVYDNDTKKPLAEISVVDKLSRRWAITDKNGSFSIVVGKEYEIEITQLGMETIKITPQNYQNGMPIYLKEQSLRLEEVTVTAVQNTEKPNASVVLDKYAISQFQAFSLSDVLQQLPGNIISKPSFNSPNVLTMRSALNESQNAFGVGFVLDGMPLSNDENMQTYSGTIRATSYSSNINSGFDLRSIPASNIEKVEVITGIPDAKYGNITTGVVLIDRKAGASPLQISASMVGGGHSVSIGKGFHLPKKWGSMNLSLDYLNSAEDPRSNLSIFNRITASSIWSYRWNDKLKNTLNFTFRSNLDDKKSDKEVLDGYRDVSGKKDMGVTLSNRTGVYLGNQWIDELHLNAGFSYSRVEDYREVFLNTGGQVVPTAMQTALHTGLYTPVAYKSVAITEGKPLNINLNLSADKGFKTLSTKHLLSMGVGLNYSDNLGEGKLLDSQSANTAGTVSSASSQGTGVRPLNFDRYVIPSKTISLYIQDNFSWNISEKQSLMANVGFRYESNNGYSSFAPRINTSFRVSPSVKLRAAMGLTSKYPSLNQLFPGDVYLDYLIKDIRTNHYALNIVQTFVEPFPRVDIKPYTLWKYEAGLDVTLAFGTMNLSAYYNKGTNGFGTLNYLKLYPIPELEFTYSSDPTEPPSYVIKGYKNAIKSHSVTSNTKHYTDQGVEVMMNFEKIKAINTQFSLSGSYVLSHSVNTNMNIIKTKDELEEEYLYGRYYPQTDKRDHLRFRLTASHHISQLGLLISLTAEQFIFSTTYATAKDIYPIGYYNKNLVYTPIPPERQQDNVYSPLVLPPAALENARWPLYHNFHLRLTKEMLSGLSLSLYATNFLDYRPKIVVRNLVSYANAPISFGGTIKYTF